MRGAAAPCLLAASCLLAAGLAWLFGGRLSPLLRSCVPQRLLDLAPLPAADPEFPMPEPGAPRHTPQGVPYADLKHVVNADGLHLFCREWEPTGPPRALVYIAHGLAEHSGPYEEIAGRLKQQSMVVFAHDHVGHGQSEGARMSIKDFQIYIRDSLLHIDLMKARYPGLPVFICGHSMGGAISILTAEERPNDFAGVVLIAPYVKVHPETASSFKVFIAKVLSRLMPQLVLGNLDSNLVTRNKEQAAVYEKDTLICHSGPTVSFGLQLMAVGARIQRMLPSINWPFYVLHGDADKLCDIQGSREMYEKATSTDKKFKVYEGAYHSLHHELPEVSESVLTEVTTWITERIPA